MRLVRLHLVASMAAASLLVSGCPRPAAPTEDAGIAVPDAGPSEPAPVKLSLEYALPDAGLAVIPLVGEDDTRPLVEPTSALELRSSLVLENYRVRLFDEAERAMVSDDVAEETAEGLLYRISLPTPLKTGHKYTLVIDAQTGTSMTDALGREVPDVRIPFQVAGEKEKPAPPPKRRRGR